MKLLSICLPVYNEEQYIKDLLNNITDQLNASLLKQVEICISDNHSDDGTDQIIQKFIEQHRNYSISYNRRNENKGFGVNFQEAIEMADAKYCWIIGADDRIKKNMLKEIINNIKEAEENDIDIIIAPYDYQDGDITKTAQIIKNGDNNKIFNMKDNTQFENYFIRVNNKYGNAGIFAFISNVIFSKKSWMACKGIPEKYTFSPYIQCFKHISTLKNGAKLYYLNKSFLLRGIDRDNGFEKYGCNYFFDLCIEIYNVISFFFEGELKDYLANEFLSDSETFVRFLNSEVNSNKINEFLSWDINLSRVLKVTFVSENNISALKDKKVVLFGASIMSTRIKEKLEKLGITIIAYLDNAETKWGSMFNDVEIKNPEQLYEFDKEGCNIVITSRYYWENYNQLIKMNLVNSRIIMC